MSLTEQQRAELDDYLAAFQGFVRGKASNQTRATWAAIAAFVTRIAAAAEAEARGRAQKRTGCKLVVSRAYAEYDAKRNKNDPAHSVAEWCAMANAADEIEREIDRIDISTTDYLAQLAAEAEQRGMENAAEEVAEYAIRTWWYSEQQKLALHRAKEAIRARAKDLNENANQENNANQVSDTL